MASYDDEVADEYRWLEELDADAPDRWVAARNAETVEALTTDNLFAGLRTGIRQVLDDAGRVPWPVWRGEQLYNFWRDPEHPRGVWRRCPVAAYRQPEPDWEILLDLDALAASEGENWVWQGAQVRRPDHRRALVQLSRGGADAVVVREFDLVERAFVADGFTLPEAKSDVGWVDDDRIYVATDFGPGSLTSSGYPRVVRRWRRGTGLDTAEEIFAGAPEDVAVYAMHDPTPGYVRDFVGRRLDFFRSENHLRTSAGELCRIDLPADAGWDVHRRWLLVRPRSPWTVGEVTYPAGALLVADFDAYLAGQRELTVLFEPDERTSLSYHAWTRDHLILALLSDVRTRLAVFTPGESGWSSAPLTAADDLDHTAIVDTEPDVGNGYLLSTSGFLRPATLLLGAVGEGAAEAVKQSPTFFDPTGQSVRQFFAVSADGTRVPYFVVGDDRAAEAPTLLTAYGGFEVSLTPDYDPVVGVGWLARGGTYVVANIRGGGEYGPQWHHRALRENRLRAYEDFAAVAADLVRRGITVPQRLGIRGGSNGGLLMGVMLTRWPELFGAIVGYVPLLDMRRYHRLLAGASWMAEYGDPDVPGDWAFLRDYSPYHNVRPGQPYPPSLFVTSTRDDRVHPAHARKMVARMREHGYDVAYYENVEGGHGVAADNDQRAFVTALTYRFLWRHLVGE